MATEMMGRVLTEARIDNLKDIWDVQAGRLPADQARTLLIPDALVSKSATLLSLPTRLINQLGLQRVRHMRSSSGPTEAWMCEAVRLTIQGRSCTMDVMEVPDTVPARIGQIPLEHLDLVVDLRNRVLIGNPAHGGVHTYEMY